MAETWLLPWRRFDDVPDEPLPRLFGVCRKALSNKRRAHGRRVALQDRIAGGAALHQRDHADAVGERNLIVAALRSLKEPDREALLLTAWEGLNPGEAAAALNCSARTFSVRLHRAKELAPGEAIELLPASVAVEDAP